DVDGDGCDTGCVYTCSTDPDCDDGEFCSGTETCDTTTHTCVAGTPEPDLTVCGTDLHCIGGECVQMCGAPEDCDPGTFCGGFPSCDVDGICRYAPEDDGTECSLDGSVPNDGVCAAGDCVAGSCPDGYCTGDEDASSCEED